MPNAQTVLVALAAEDGTQPRGDQQTSKKLQEDPTIKKKANSLASFKQKCIMFDDWFDKAR